MLEKSLNKLSLAADPLKGKFMFFCDEACMKMLFSLP